MLGVILADKIEDESQYRTGSGLSRGVIPCLARHLEHERERLRGAGPKGQHQDAGCCQTCP
jgi:hypothetical protein